MTVAEDIAASCLAARVRKVNRVITGVYDAQLRPIGLKIAQLNILVVAAKLGVARPAEIGKILDIDPSTLSRNLERMRKRHWIEALEDERDARSQPFRLTSAGQKLLLRAYPLWVTAQERALEAMGAPAAQALRESPAASLSFG